MAYFNETGPFPGSLYMMKKLRSKNTDFGSDGVKMIRQGFQGQSSIIEMNNSSPHRLLDSSLFFIAEFIKIVWQFDLWLR
jgi:hypothetical protein